MTPSFDDVVRALAARDFATGAYPPPPADLDLDTCRVSDGVDVVGDDTDGYTGEVRLMLFAPPPDPTVRGIAVYWGKAVWSRTYTDVPALWRDLLEASTLLEARARAAEADRQFIEATVERQKWGSP